MNTLDMDPRLDLAEDATELVEWSRLMIGRFNTARRFGQLPASGVLTMAHQLHRRIESACIGAWYSGNSTPWRESRLTIGINAAARLGALATEHGVATDNVMGRFG